jgi:DNA-binding HxlR family transcriptional regulator
MVVRLHDEARRFRELAADLGALSAMAPELLAEQLKAIGR